LRNATGVTGGILPPQRVESVVTQIAVEEIIKTRTRQAEDQRTVVHLRENEKVWKKVTNGGRIDIGACWCRAAPTPIIPIGENLPAALRPHSIASSKGSRLYLDAIVSLRLWFPNAESAGGQMMSSPAPVSF